MFELVPFERSMRRMMNYDPFRSFSDMERSFFGSGSAVSAFRTDIKDMGESYRLEAELPGFAREDISVDIENELLTISAERKRESEEKKDSFVRRERFYGSFKRSFDISGIDADNISAAYTDGVLSLDMPKKQELLPRSRKLEIQ